MNFNNITQWNFYKLNKNNENILYLSTWLWKTFKSINNFKNDNYLDQKIKLKIIKDKKAQEKLLTNFNYSPSKIKVLAIGGAGNNILNQYLSKHKIYNKNIEFYALNTEFKPLKILEKKCSTLLLDPKGLGAGSNPNNARICALNNKDKIKNIIQDADLLILIAGIGKGTGSGATPVIAEFAKEMDIATLSLVFYPEIYFSSSNKIEEYDYALNQIKKYSSSISILENKFFSRAEWSNEQCHNFANEHLIDNLKNILSVAGCLYSEIDSCDFNNFVKSENKLSFFNIKMNSNDFNNEIQNSLVNVNKIYNLDNQNIKKVLVLCNLGWKKDMSQENSKIFSTHFRNHYQNNEINFNFGLFKSKNETTELSIILAEPKINEKDLLANKEVINTNDKTINYNQSAAFAQNNNKEMNFTKSSNIINNNESDFVKVHKNRKHIDINDQGNALDTNDVLYQTLTSMMSSNTTRKIN